jgi:hypothetical protein
VPTGAVPASFSSEQQLPNAASSSSSGSSSSGQQLPTGRLSASESTDNCICQSLRQKGKEAPLVVLTEEGSGTGLMIHCFCSGHFMGSFLPDEVTR